MNSNIQTGDVLVFKANDSYISKTIAWLTNSSVSHAAMVYDNDKIVEMHLGGIKINDFDTSKIGKSVYQLRHTANLDPKPLIEVADKYIAANSSYDLSSLFFIAGLLIYKSIRPTAQTMKITDYILRVVCKRLNDFLNSSLHPDDKYQLICSQLVYLCYHESGPIYDLGLKHGLLENIDDKEYVQLVNIAKNDTKAICIPTYESFYFTQSSVIKICEDLYISLNNDKNNLRPSDFDFDEIIPRVKEFINLVEKFLDKYDIDLPVDALFITPVDLLKNCTNLNIVQGIVE